MSNLEVICPAFGRTGLISLRFCRFSSFVKLSFFFSGTNSLQLALNELGYKCHHMYALRLVFLHSFSQVCISGGRSETVVVLQRGLRLPKRTPLGFAVVIEMHSACITRNCCVATPRHRLRTTCSGGDDDA